MMQTLSLMVVGGEATAGPPIGPALGPLGIPAGKVVAEINQKTAEFKGMQVPIKLKINPATKEFQLEIGVPLTSAMIKKEISLDKASGDGTIVGDISWEQVLKVAKEKQAHCLGKGLKEVAKEVIGTCKSMGLTIDGKPAGEFLEEVTKMPVD